MQEQKRVRNDEAQGFEMGRELTEDELAMVCGGTGNAGNAPNTSTGNTSSLGNLTNLSQLGNELTGQITSQLSGLLGTTPAPATSSNQNNAATNGLSQLSNIPGLAPLQNLLGGLGL